MNSQQHDFTDLRRLLALKRHEQPPPGYFEHFSGEIIARIRSGATGEEPSWLDTFWFAVRRFWTALEAKPVIAGGFGLSVCGVLLAGLLIAEPGDAGNLALGSASPAVELQGSPYAPQAPAAAQFSTFEPVSTIAPQDSLFLRVNGGQRAEAMFLNATKGY